jgi:hypothetical protein
MPVLDEMRNRVHDGVRLEDMVLTTLRLGVMYLQVEKVDKR